MERYSLHDGKRIVGAARNTIELFLGTHNFNPAIIERTLSDLTEKRGLFITLEHYPTNTPRGSSGTVKPMIPLHTLVPATAIAAATEDPKMVPISHMEFEHLIIEAALLSVPELVQVRSKVQLPRRIKPDVHGLYIEYGYHQATMLPGTAARNRWELEVLLDNLCVKANLPVHAWRLGGAKLYTFTAQRFREQEPRGEVEEIAFE